MNQAIILQTKQNRAGFGLMSKGSVEVTAAVSERALDKKKVVQKQLPDAYNQKMNGMHASKQADFYENYLEKKYRKLSTDLSQQYSDKFKEFETDSEQKVYLKDIVWKNSYDIFFMFYTDFNKFVIIIKRNSNKKSVKLNIIKQDRYKKP